jgi:CBS domain-containing protein
MELASNMLTMIGELEMKVEDLMNPNVIYAEVPGSRDQVFRTIQQKKISGMPVVKKGTRNLIGIITREDLLKNSDEDQLALIMTTNVVTITPETSFDDCLKLMKEKGFRRIPVISNNELKGIITVGDIIHKVVAKSDSKAIVRDFMRRRVFSCWSRTPAYIASKILHLANEYVALVVDDEEKIVGIVSSTDLIGLGEMKLEETKSVLKSGSESQEWDWETSSVLYITKNKIALPNIPLQQVMTTPCITISESASIIECAIKMQKHDIDQLPVVNSKDEIIGMIFDIDMIKSI